MIRNTTKETGENPMGNSPNLKISRNRKLQAIFRRKKLPPYKNNFSKNTAAKLQLYAATWSISGPMNVLLN